MITCVLHSYKNNCFLELFHRNLNFSQCIARGLATAVCDVTCRETYNNALGISSQKIKVLDYCTIHYQCVHICSCICVPGNFHTFSEEAFLGFKTCPPPPLNYSPFKCLALEIDLLLHRMPLILVWRTNNIYF